MKKNRICTREEAKPCPFCGSQPRIEPWHGGAKTKRHVHCTNDHCWVHPGVTGPTPGGALARWNIRREKNR